jgi:SAM-dependent methyltransferase
MHIKECYWIISKLEKFNVSEISPVLDFGGSTLKYRTLEQPWLQNNFYKKLKNREIKILFADLKKSDGVDLAGDIFDDNFLSLVKSKKFNCVFCCNFLEHVNDPQELIDRCMSLIPVGGILVITVPHSYPYHRDPIDTLFRPNIKELSKLVKGNDIIDSEIISTGSYRDHLKKNPLKIFRHLRFFFPFLGLEKWKRSNYKLKWLFTDFKQSCMIVRKSK